MHFNHEGKSRFARKVAPSVALLASTALIAQPSLAQDDGSEEANRRLDVVTVTSQKREQDILDVPAAVTAISADTLEASAVADFSDLARVAPSLTFNTGTNNGNNSINLRGVGTVAFSIGVEPSVSVVVDDVAVVQQAQAFSSLVDIERVEILRGPQGTLFGKNASAGVVNIVTKGPTEELSGSAEFVTTDDDENRLNMTLSGPVGDAAGFRINANIYEREGHITNLFDGGKYNGEEGSGVRAKFNWDATDQLSVSLVAEHTERTSAGTATTLFSVADDARLFGAIPADLTIEGITPSEDNLFVRRDTPPLSKNRQSMGSLRLAYDIGEFELVSISSYQEWDYRFQEEVDGSAFNILGAFTGGAFSGGLQAAGPFETEGFTQEIRLQSPVYDAFDYMVGVYYSDADTARAFERGPVIFRADWEAETGTTSYAVFGQGTLRLNDQWDLSGGLRLNNEEISVKFDNILDMSGAFAGSDSESAVTGKLALQHFVSDDVTVFASVSTGYKGQGYDVSTGFDQDRADNPVGSETSISYELGLKSRLFDDRVQLNATAFLTDYEDFQAQSGTIDPVTFATDIRLRNVGELRTQGVELDALAQVSDNLRLNGSLAVIDATIESYPGAQCYAGQTEAEGCLSGLQDLSGSDLSNSPDLKFTLGATYERQLSILPFDLVANIGYTWQDDVNFDLTQNPLTTQDAYGLLNASISLVESSSGHFQITLFGQNLTDERYVADRNDLRVLYGGSPVLTQVQPRDGQSYYGVRLKAGF